MQELTEKEINVMKHCIGLNYKKPYKRHGREFYKPYRNRYATYVYNEIWNGLVGKGLAKHMEVNEKQQTMFYLTGNGIDALSNAIGVYIYDEEG